eukprot:m.184520 g.184520  ORF g.184520 m.184520 type:complete len:498 (+) comp32195_c0_seq2:156-1649(+)
MKLRPLQKLVVCVVCTLLFGAIKLAHHAQQQQPPDELLSPKTHARQQQRPARDTSQTTKQCKDDSSDCSEWAKLGECQRNPKYMHDMCRLSCQRCRAVDVQTENQLDIVSRPARESKMRLYDYGGSPLADIMRSRNKNQIIQNFDAFGAHVNLESMVVFVVMVHKRADNLEYLIDSMRQAKGIEQTLVIFSQDFEDSRLTSAIEAIDFCLTTRIFLPTSTQLHPTDFPGTDPKDCPVKHADGTWVTPEEAETLNCQNKKSPDTYNHYREARYTQIKHHWWWKANFLFDEMKILAKHTGYVVFLEEDHYLAPDAVVVAQLLAEKAKAESKPTMIGLGTYLTRDLSKNSWSDDTQKTITKFWHPTQDNMGMGFTWKIWQDLKCNNVAFCDFDDYNWDWTIYHLAHEGCFDQEHTLRILQSVAPRVFHLGKCGMHAKAAECSTLAARKQIDDVFQLTTVKQKMFPSFLVTADALTKKQKQKPNGGWGDPRDKQLCKHMAS